MPAKRGDIDKKKHASSGAKANVSETQSYPADQANRATARTSEEEEESDMAEVKKMVKEMKEEMKAMHETLLKALADQGQKMECKMSAMHEEAMGEIRGLAGRVTTVEKQAENTERWTADISEELREAREERDALRQKLTDLETRSRRNNIRISGIAEGVEGNDKDAVLSYMNDFLKGAIPTLADMDLNIQRAHRTFAKKPAEGERPRAFVVAFQEDRVKERVLRDAWKKGTIESQGKRVYFDPDFPPEVVQKRKMYNPIKKALKKEGIRFQTPMTGMRILWENGNNTKYYASAHEAEEDLKVQKIPVEKMVLQDRPPRRDGRGAMESRGEVRGAARRVERRLEEYRSTWEQRGQ